MIYSVGPTGRGREVLSPVHDGLKYGCEGRDPDARGHYHRVLCVENGAAGGAVGAVEVDLEWGALAGVHSQGAGHARGTAVSRVAGEITC